MLKEKEKKLKSPSGLKNEEKKVSKKDDGLNILGFPKDDPYGLVEAWWKIFTKPKIKSKKLTSAKDFYI